MVTLTLELKLIAQVGLIGLPNAGKSTLLASITRAKPEIAAYPFTTLEPNLGVLQLPRRRIIIADVPGLIAGASEGKGLGHAFLRHIERTKLLVHLVDVSKGPEELWADYETVRNELNTFSPSLRRKKEIIVLSKTDLANHEQIQEVGKLFRGHDLEVLTISAATGEGLNQLISEITAKSK
ncbi:50S ribosome-binding GTPase [Candidatus Curtissbacteria bacterium]|nr:50S ribosome-binding GTPase [Candidatus Curtissbacteria bacterium]